MQYEINTSIFTSEIEVTIAKIRVEDLRKKLNLKLSAVIETINYFLCHKNNNNLYDKKFWFYRSLEKFADSLGVNVTTLCRYLKKLYNLGILTYEKFKRSNRDHTNFYTINYDKLEELGIRITKKTRIIKIRENSTNWANNIENTSDDTANIVENNNQIQIQNEEFIDQQSKNLVNEQEFREAEDQVKLLAKEYDISEWQIWPLIKNKTAETIKNSISYCRDMISQGKVNRPAGYIIKALQNGWEDEKVVLERRLQQEHQAKQQEFLENLQQNNLIKADTEQRNLNCDSIKNSEASEKAIVDNNSWIIIKEKLKDFYNGNTYENWLADLEFLGIKDGNQIVLKSPSRFVRDWVINNFLSKIRQLWHENNEEIIAVTIVT